MTTTVPSPVVDWVNLDDMWADPLPTFHRLLAESPVAYSPAFDRYFVVRFADCDYIERHPELFHPDMEPRSLMKRAIGPNMLTKQDPAHAEERTVVNPALRPKLVRSEWKQTFAGHAERFMRDLREEGPGADFVERFAVPFAAANLGAVVGLKGASWQDVNRWSAAFIASVGNHARDDRVFREGERANAEIESLLDALIPHYRRQPDASMLSLMANSAMPLELIMANAKLAVSGGVNEPQHTLANGVWALDLHPEQRRLVVADPDLFSGVFDETLRWLSPITMIGRRALADVELSGVPIPEGAYLFAAVGAANRDPEKFENPDLYDVTRPRSTHLAFGAGIHLCAGSWVARVSVAEVGWPMLFAAFPGLRPVDAASVRHRGLTFRGVPSMPVTWDM